MEVIDFPNYLVYPDGRIFAKGMSGQGKNKEGRWIKPFTHKKGYLYYSLTHNKKKKNFLLHRLIAIHYIPNPYNFPCIDHIDRNKQNNTIENLRWCSFQTNNRNLGSWGKVPHKHISQYGKNNYRDDYLKNN